MQTNKNMSDMTARKSRHFYYFADIYLPLFLLVATIIVFRDTKLDLSIQGYFYHPNTEWYLKDNPLFRFLYHYGNIPALLLSISGLIVFWKSFQVRHWVKWRKIGIFLVLAMVLGPGVIINTVLKDNWGRPRPRNTIEFGGKYAFEKVLSIDNKSPGMSFPCGHASMGFYLFIPWFILRKKHKGLAKLSLCIGMGYGLLIGLARIAQGGHYSSDVLIAGILTFLTGTALFYALKFNHAIWYYPKHEEIDIKQRNIVSVTVFILLFFLILGVILATPYDKKYRKSSELMNQANGKPITLYMQLYSADLTMQQADSMGFSSNIQGFGFPGSKINNVYHEQIMADTLKIDYTQIRKGFFTELINDVNAKYNFQSNSRIKIKMNKGNAKIALPDSLKKLVLDIEIDNGTLDLDLPNGFKPRIKLLGDFKLTDKTGFNSADSIFVNQDFKVNIIVVKGEVILH